MIPTRLKRLLCQCIPARHLTTEDIGTLGTVSSQMHLLALPLPKTYLLLILKLIVARCTLVCEEVYLELTRLIALKQSKCALEPITYILGADLCVKITENSSMGEQGTTGLRTWPASLCLIEYLLENHEANPMN